MKKHLIIYTVLVSAIAVLAGQLTTQKKSAETAVSPIIKTQIIRDENLEKELEKLRKSLIEKDGQIAELKIQNKKLSTVEKKQKVIANDEIKEVKPHNITSLLDAVGGFMNNEQVTKSQKMFKKKQLAALFKKLNLNEEAEDALVDLLVDRDREKQAKLTELLKADNGKIDMAALEEIQKKTQAEEHIAELLGDNYEKFERYEKTAMERNQLKDITASLNQEDSLNEDQQEKLIDIMAQRNKDRMTGQEVDNEKYLTEASDFLNDNQVDEVRKSFKRNKASSFTVPAASGTGSSSVQFFTIP